MIRGLHRFIYYSCGNLVVGCLCLVCLCSCTFYTSGIFLVNPMQDVRASTFPQVTDVSAFSVIQLLIVAKIVLSEPR